MAKKIPKHGGKRAGAGRKPLDAESDAVRVVTDLPADIAKRLDAYVAKQESTTRAKVVREAVTAFLNAK